MTQLPENVILIGYRATGKSTVGRLLAERLGYRFLDTDRELEERQGGSIRQLVAQHGWEYFRQREQELLLELLERRQLVIAAGGGVILHQQIWPRVMQSGLVVWLTADSETICERLTADHRTVEQRPSLTGGGIGEEVAAVLAEREPLYRGGMHLRVDTVSRSPAQIVAEIEAYLAGSGPREG